MTDFFAGAGAVASLGVGLFFFRFWRATRDRLFGAFALGFLVLAANRVALVVLDAAEARVAVYGLRLAAFTLIIAAIVDKNRST